VSNVTVAPQLPSSAAAASGKQSWSEWWSDLWSE
jgi:hypothetical protein